MDRQAQHIGESVYPAVLICEADEVERQRILSMLGDTYQVAVAAKPGEALVLIQRGAFLVLLLSVDRKNGAQELNAIQAISIMHKIDPDLKIIVMAAEANSGETESLELEREIRSKGIFYYMLKPIEEGELTKALAEAIQCSMKTKAKH